MPVLVLWLIQSFFGWLSVAKTLLFGFAKWFADEVLAKPFFAALCLFCIGILSRETGTIIVSFISAALVIWYGFDWDTYMKAKS